MFKPVSLFLALRYAFKRNSSGFAAFISASSTLGITLGVMVLIVVLSAMNGFEKALADRLLSVVPHAELEVVNDPMLQWPSIAQKLLKNPQVIAVAPVIKLPAMIQKSGLLKGVEIRAVDSELEQQVSDIKSYISQGSWSALAQGNSVVLGAGVAKKLKASVGDKVQILLPKPVDPQKVHNQFPAPTVRHVTVVGIFTFGGVIDDTLTYMSLAQGQEILGYETDQVRALRIKLADVFQAPHLVKELAYETGYYVYMHDWTRTQGHLFQDIQLVRTVMLIVLALVIAVASFNIVSTLIMVVNEKKGDIAILKTMGASSTTVMISFIVQGLINGVLGCLIGGVSGVYIALNLTEIIHCVESVFSTHFLSGDIYFIDFIPSELYWPDVYITLSIALLLSLLATIYPAWRATKVEPAQVLGQL